MTGSITMLVRSDYLLIVQTKCLRKELVFMGNPIVDDLNGGNVLYAFNSRPFVAQVWCQYCRDPIRL